jgi:hypothetical protein
MLPIPGFADYLLFTRYDGAADCPKAQATSPAERCFVIFPQLLDLPTARPAAK